MGLFGTSTPYDTDVDKATSEQNTTELWDVIIDICDKVNSNTKTAKDCLKSILRRLGNDDPHVALQAVTLLDACVNNCGRPFHLEVASREFETEFRKLLAKCQPTVAMKMRLSLKKWAESTFKTDPQLNLIPSLYKKLKEEGHDFTDASVQQPKLQPLSKDPNVVSSQQEEDDIAKAIELSLKENKGGSPKTLAGKIATSSSIYPSMTPGDNVAAASRTTEQRKVRALYDFEAAEDNELTFLAGEIIHVMDDTDPNWWKGYNHRGEGLFPSNFVSADLSAEPEPLNQHIDSNKIKKSVVFSDEQKKEAENEIIEIDEEKIDRLLHLLHEANPEDPSQDSYEMLQLEAQVNQMLPLIDMELERVDRKHAQLTQLSKDLVESNNLYHSLMREPERPISAFVGYPQNFNPPIYHGHPAASGLNNGLYTMPNMFPISQTMAPTSLPNMQPVSMPMSMMGGQQPMMLPPNFAMGPQFPPHHLIPPHLQNGHLPGQQHSQQQQHQPSSQQMSSQPPVIQQGVPQHGIQMMQPPSSMPQQNIANNSIQQQQPIPQATIQQIPQSTNTQTMANHHVGTMNTPGQNIYAANFPNMPMTGLPPPAGQTQMPHGNLHIQPPPSSSSSHQQNIPAYTNPHIQQPPSSGLSHMGPPGSHLPMNHSPLHQNMIPTVAMTQPITTNILPQTDNRTNIPIYQQQR